MGLQAVLETQTDFTGEFPAEYAKDGLWRFNESGPDGDTMLADSSGKDRKMYVNGWSGTTASLRAGFRGNYFRFNITNPATEKTYLKATNDGSIFSAIGERIIVGGWMNPTTYSVGNTYTPIFNTRQGPGQPIFYLSLIRGKPRIMLYNSAGSLILDESVTLPFSFVNNGWYFIACVIEPGNKKAQYVIGDRGSGEVWVSAALSFTGELNRSCTADLIMGMHANSYWFAGGFDDWFLDCDSELTAEDLADYFLATVFANGGDTTGNVDAVSAPGGVTLRKSNGAYPESGVLYTRAVEYGISGAGKISVSGEYVSGVTSVSLVETSTSNDLENWSDWAAVGTDGKMPSPGRAYIRFRVTLTTTDTSKTPKLVDIRINDTPKSPYEKIGYARPVILDSSGAWEAVLENAYGIIVTGEVNGEDTLTFSIPFADAKRKYIDNEKKIQIVDDVYTIRTVTDSKDASGNAVTEVYAEAEFYNLAYSVRKEEKAFDAEMADVPMAYALSGTEWNVGRVTVTTKRTWTSTEKNALSILRNVADLHGGDLVFDCPNRLVHLLILNGKDSGALFMYGKNMKDIERTVDTTGLVTRLYAVGADGMTFASINGGKPYVEDFTYSKEVRVSSLDCSAFTNPYQMLEFTRMRLADYCRPTISYVLNAMDLSVLTGYEHEAWELGDYVRVEDKDLGAFGHYKDCAEGIQPAGAVEHGAGAFHGIKEPGQLHEQVGQCRRFLRGRQRGVQRGHCGACAVQPPAEFPRR